MRRLVIACALLASLVAGCDERKSAQVAPPPQTMTAAAIGTYCGMSLIEHAGPKGQILLASRPDPLWFSSARDAIAFTLLPEEAKDIRAVYVSDMAKAPSWEHPGPDNWVLAENAVFVIDSDARGGMGAEEAVPFSDRAAAAEFAARRAGRLATLSEIPRTYVLGSGEAARTVPEIEPSAHKHAPTGTH